MMLLASADGNRVPVIAQLVPADEDTVRDVIHRFNEIGLACLDPRWAGGRSRHDLLQPLPLPVGQSAHTDRLGHPASSRRIEVRAHPIAMATNPANDPGQSTR
jgi:hypothetical protein